MIENVVAVCRTIACDARLLLLYHLSLAPELPAGELAERAGYTRGSTSNQLRELAAAGLVERRRSGGRVFYTLAPDEATSPGGFRVAGLIRRALSDPRWATRGWREQSFVHVSADSVRRLPAEVGTLFDVMYDACTAFTNVRRLQILGLLRRGGACTSGLVERELRMSPEACWRHMDKLARRAYVRPDGRGKWRLGGGGWTEFHRGLKGLVERHLGS